MNLVTLVGNLGADPELSQTAGGALLRMSVATTYVYFDKDKNRQEKTEWHKVKVWGRRAEGLARILSKGSRVVVQGRIESSTYEKDGQKHNRTNIVATDIFLGGRGGGDRPRAGEDYGQDKGQDNGMMSRALPSSDLSASALPF